MANESKPGSYTGRIPVSAQGDNRRPSVQREVQESSEPIRKRRSLILCFDGTGNKFQGNSGDSNILKIFSCLDQEDENQISYYQPGIGTYVESSSLSKTGRIERIKSWYAKAKDQAVGTSLDSHVMAGYRFLMRYYTCGDNIYMFGFSRGAYTARFLAQMLDSVGLLSQGNEEMERFAWKTFAKWQTRVMDTEADRKQAAETYRYMKAFRFTFSRPIRRIRFLGLFDTVCSVPKFESAWMSRSKFPYQASSSVKVIRHAVSIDERRAKFRQDLISEQKPPEDGDPHPHMHRLQEGFDHITHRDHHHHHGDQANGEKAQEPEGPLLPKSMSGKDHVKDRFHPKNRRHLDVRTVQERSLSPTRSTMSLDSRAAAQERYIIGDDGDDEDDPQDIEEIWFPGCHADIGGGWPLVEEKGFKEEFGLSHPPLIWMIREARKAGCPFDEDALREMDYILEEEPIFEEQDELDDPEVPVIQVDGEAIDAAPASYNEFSTPAQSKAQLEHIPEVPPKEPGQSSVKRALDFAAGKGKMHDSLSFGQGTPPGGVITWKIMEYLPFRRMDLGPDGKWGTQRWPLPMGEPRDMPDAAWIHWTAIKRMQENEKYRPGTLIQGGGRARKVAPKESGIGQWRTKREKGNPVGECYVRVNPGGTNLSQVTGPAVSD